MFSLFKPRKKLPESFERWKTVDIIINSECLAIGPTTKVRNLKQWLDAQERWQAGYDEFIKAEQTLTSTSGYVDDFDRRHHEHYAALLLQSGQWLAILLKMIDHSSEEERSRHLQDLDVGLGILRQRIRRDS